MDEVLQKIKLVLEEQARLRELLRANELYLEQLRKQIPVLEEFGSMQLDE